jgi:Na+/H+-dicarboxylate symporter
LEVAGLLHRLCYAGQPPRRCRLIVGIDRFMSEARAVTNFSGNGVATVIIGEWTRRGRGPSCMAGTPVAAQPTPV